MSYWNPVEVMPVPELKSLQLKQLKMLVYKLYTFSPFYRQKMKDAGVTPEDIQELAPYVLSHRIWLGPHAASHGLTSELVVKDVVAKVPIP